MINENSKTGTFLYIVLGIILAFGVNTGLGFLLGTDMPIVAVESNSMIPTFYKGDILILQGVQSPKEADIIVFSVSDRATPIVHRIIELNPDETFQTKGDNNYGQLPFEKSISKEQIHGKVISIIPYIGWVKIGLTEFVFNYIIPNFIWVVIIAVAATALYIAFFGSDDYNKKYRFRPKNK
ncbi:MAG: signal peptidase I [Candidatus Aenigmarchaeota archaeon]|nr:signal peptidase I [Candidatus Aenigmarchaeota archaeon]